MSRFRCKLFFLIVLAILFCSSIMLAVTFWNSRQSDKSQYEIIRTRFTQHLSLVVESLWQEHGELTPANSREVMSHITCFTDELDAFAIFDSDKNLIFDWGKPVSSGLKPRYAVRFDGAVIGWVSCIPSNPSCNSMNRRQLTSVIQTILAGMIPGILVAFAISSGMSLSISRTLRRFVSALGSLSRGNRDISFSKHGSCEFHGLLRASARLQDVLAKNERQRQRWLQDIVHDLKTPVTALRVQIEAIGDGVLTLSPKRLDTLESELTRMDTLIQDLSLLSGVDSPEMMPVIKQIDATSFLQQIENRFTPMAVATGIHLKCRSDFRQGFVILSDPYLLSRAVNNLVQNALQHTPFTENRGIVTVQIIAEDDDTTFIVENPGYIPESILPGIFERYHRGNSSRSTPDSGLGLAIVQGIARKLGGSITVKNTSMNTVRMRISVPQQAWKAE